MAVDANLRALVRRRWLVTAPLSLAVVVIYFGFILLIAFDPAFMSLIVVQGLSVGILLGALVIVASWMLTYVYVRWANTQFDEAVRAISRSDSGGKS